MSILTLADLEQLEQSISAILTLLPAELRQNNNLDVDGKAIKQDNKKVRFVKDCDNVKPSPSTPSLPSNNNNNTHQSKEELRAKFQAKLLQVQRKPSEKKKPKNEPKKKQTKKQSSNKPSKVEPVIKPNHRVENMDPSEAKANEEPTSLILSQLKTEKTNHTKLGTKKKTADPKQLLQMAQKSKDKLRDKRSKSDDPQQFDSQVSLRSALKKARGDKLHDDTKLLKEAVKKREQRKKKSAKEWGKRLKQAEKVRVEKQKKRTDNIAARQAKRLKKKHGKRVHK